MECPIKPLKFIHITKTAGSSIETVGLENNIRWGIYHKEYGFWHEIFTNKPKELRDKYDWFTVVRNPYQRILSEYHFLVEVLNINNHTKGQFNLFIQNWMINASKNKKNHPEFGRIGGDHFTEQYKYIDNTSKIHILKFENIEEEFESLMKQYNLNLKLNKKVQVSKNKKYSVQDISKENIKLINIIYKKDFELFNYTMIEINGEPNQEDEQELLNNELEQKSNIDEPPDELQIVIKPRIETPKKDLRFIHISRTAGTSIEQIGLEHGKFWGRYHRGYGQYDEIFKRKPEPLKKAHDWFTVVRNPYTRLISDYHYLVLLLRINNPENISTFNTFIEKWMKNIQNNKENNGIHGKVTGGHFTPQNLYIPLTFKIHILKYENLEEEFNKLMNQYNCNIILNKKVNISKTYVSVNDISKENIELIKKVYKKDFEDFGYSMELP